MAKQTFNVSIYDSIRIRKHFLDSAVVNVTEDENNLRIDAQMGITAFNLFKGNKNTKADYEKYQEYLEGLSKNRYEIRVYPDNKFKPTLEKKLV